MNKMNQLFQKSILQFICALLAFSGYAQKIEQDTINGEVFYVYPFQNEVTVHSNYYLAVKRSKGKQYSFKQYYIDLFGENYNKKEYRKSKRMMMARSLANKKYRKKQKHLDGKFKKAVRNNPYPLLEQRYTLENDVIPCLDQIPDGKYVQYFKDYYPIGKNGKLVNQENRISGIFSIKNNLLDGEAVWFNVKGDTLKKGRFEKGLKVGKWILETRKADYSLNKEDALLYVERGYPDMDTSREIVHYSNGFKNGYYAFYMNSVNPIFEGSYLNNEPTGQWTERTVGYIGKGKARVRNRNNTIVTWTYTESSADSVVHQAIIRKDLIEDESYSNEFNFDAKYDPAISFNKLFSFNFPKELDLELEEEKMNSYEGEEYEEDLYGYEDESYYEEEYYGDEYYDVDRTFKKLVYDQNSGKYISMSKLIDSLGIIFNYEGVYEKRYPNGQLMVRYEFEKGKLKKEDTIFWDNGKPYDVVTFIPDSNHYVQTIHDYDGKLFNEIVFDSTGEFIRVNFQPERFKYVMIDGFKAQDEGNGKYFFYDKLDTLEHVLTDSLILFRSWYKEDTSLLYSRTYIPQEHQLKFDMYSIAGRPSMSADLKFSEEFESWTGTKEYRLGDLTLKTTTSASFVEYAEKDSIPQRHVNEFAELFNLTEDYQLFKNDQAYTGEVALIMNEEKFSFSSGKSIKITLPRAYTMTMDLMKDVYKFRTTGKTKNEVLLNTIDASELDEDFGSGIYSSLFGGFLNDYVEYPYSEYYEMELGENEKYKEKKGPPISKKVLGYMKDGKPQGIWKVYDQFGKIMIEIPFENGLVDGTLKQYDKVSPKSSFDFFSDQPEYLNDTLPKKETHYLYSTSEYKKGVANGQFNKYNWVGQLNQQENYKDGYLEGPAFERNNLAYTSLNYHEGALDGYVRTYLTLKGQDSILLFDLNFQNGMLQGESKSYHTNGKLAKKGFFLNGQSIDDYEAFDSLGFRYHYVKFLYSFPVEEKIWEENELSVRYEYDWRDSIYFQPTDITSSQSLDRILAQLGIGRDYYERPYYGRPSLVEKQGIDYKITKYYPNDTIAREGEISAGKKVGCWKYYSYDGEFLYEVDYFDTILKINDSIQFKAKGLLADYNSKGDKISESYIIEKFEKYDCSHTDHYEIRQLMTTWQGKDSIDRMNGYVKNYYDNGVLQNEGMMKDGLPTGVWKFYDPYGKLNQVGTYVLGKRDGRWLGGDLSKTKYLGDICLNPNLPDLEEEIKYREKLLDIIITNYRLGKALNKEFYDVNMNDFEEEIMDEELEIIEEE